MKKQIVAAILLLVLLLPMFAGISRIKRLPRAPKKEDEGPKDDGA
ncbi:hypothetical protein Swit_1257 [Rhizorhabdus wittichii RW1]|uniref:Uncharacterized protein n=1 Tax=Rhizorhabdus wittichii (strain DSM 6014 / CCUG 31198 / JCM 15750 / NBRC 105917 / EY 4224 / RW1) TaxID=392499 RepID=A0A9J9LBR0_RHIWR|nr:hypothetical protein Swit_1257 [Rhizorhabdus wittichii RW1]